jgi:hypothetical protein
MATQFRDGQRVVITGPYPQPVIGVVYKANSKREPSIRCWANDGLSTLVCIPFDAPEAKERNAWTAKPYSIEDDPTANALIGLRDVATKMLEQLTREGDALSADIRYTLMRLQEEISASFKAVPPQGFQTIPELAHLGVAANRARRQASQNAQRKPLPPGVAYDHEGVPRDGAGEAKLDYQLE